MRDTWIPKPADRSIRPDSSGQQDISPLHFTVRTRRVPHRALTSPWLLLYVFAGLVIVGTLLLLPPFTQRGEGFTPFTTAFFTAASAVTLTGLAVEDTAAYWTRYGQAFILALTFAGGLSYMAIASFLLILIGQRAFHAPRLPGRERIAVNPLRGFARLSLAVAAVSCGIQLLGFLALLARFLLIYPPAEAVWQAAFHAVSAFNNAGFVALNEPAGLGSFQSDTALILILAALVLLGGLGYLVLIDVFTTRRLSRLSLNTKLVLILTLTLLAAGVAVFLSSEYQNPGTLGAMPVADKLLNSLFHSVSARTAGFSAVHFAQTNQETNFFFMSLMFIGGASASAAGGIKVNTVAIVVFAVLSTVRGKSYPSVFGRELPLEQIQRAMVVGAVSTIAVFGLSLLLIFTEAGVGFIALLFESFSAFGTAGLSAGATPELSTPGRLILVATMLFGRLGPLTIALAMAQRATEDRYRFPTERVTIG